MVAALVAVLLDDGYEVNRRGRRVGGSSRDASELQVDPV